MVTFEMGNPDPVTMFCYADFMFTLKCGRTTGPGMPPLGAMLAFKVSISPSHASCLLSLQLWCALLSWQSVGGGQCSGLG